MLPLELSPPCLLEAVMYPNGKEVLEAAHVSANQGEGPQNMHDGDFANKHAEKVVPRKSMRSHKPHTMWKEYVKG
jgi:hypothetical protein